MGLLLINSACYNDESDNKAGNTAVSVVKNDGYYSVTLDYLSGLSRREMGAEYMKAILAINADYQSLADSYLKDVDTLSSLSTKFAGYSTLISRVSLIKPQLRSEYLEELEGMASILTETADVAGDGKLSANELFAMQLFPDLGRGWACSGFSVFGSKSATGETITGRNLDFLTGFTMQMPKVHAVITIKYNNSSICMIGFLGNVGVVSAFNDEGVFAGILDSPVGGTAIDCTGKNSYTLDIRYALENFNTKEDVASYMTDASRLYTWNHNILLSDINGSLVVENNFTVTSSTGSTLTGKRAIRTPESALNPGITWGFADAIAVVNSNISEGTFDNHTQTVFNTGRWGRFLSLMGAAPAKLGKDDVKSIIGNHTGASVSEHIYCGVESAAAKNNISMNIHSVIFEPKTKDLQVYFVPETGPLADPVYKSITVDFN